MNVKPIHMSDLYKNCDDIYEAVMVVAKRAKQIIDDRVIPIDENEEVEVIEKGRELEPTDELNNTRKKRRRSSASIE